MASQAEGEERSGLETATTPPNSAARSDNGPRIDIQISFDRSTHSYSQPEPPKITITAISRAKHPITVFTWRRPLDPHGALSSSGYSITDLSTGNHVKTTHVMINRTALLRVRGSSDEKYFLTLLPNTPVELSIGFGRGRGGVKPDPRSVVERGWERDEQGNERKIRRSSKATGVDGLEPGHTYSVGLNMESLRACWWAPVTKDEILVNQRGEGSYVQDYPWNKDTPLDFRVSEATIEVLE
ncbi:hypothetical protein F4808DRAFT_475328 [Astrocystis sublimbata]|nr:hypothetical protein F4808DRAFT_475328 [Astrocystis sublimbata]